jgi:thioredoxin-related protein
VKNVLILVILIFPAFAFSSISIDKFSGVSLTSEKEETIEVTKNSKPLVVIFISKDCPCSKGNLSYINSLSKDYPEFIFIGVHSKKGTALSDVKNYLNDKKINFEVLNDAELSIASKFNALKTPHAFIVNLKGEVIYSGGVTNSTFPEHAKEFFLKNALQNLKNNIAIAKSETKTLGCFIVR